MAGWLAEGKLKTREDIAAGGIEKFPETLLRLFEGRNMGKLVLTVAEGEPQFSSVEAVRSIRDQDE